MAIDKLLKKWYSNRKIIESLSFIPFYSILLLLLSALLKFIQTEKMLLSKTCLTLSAIVEMILGQLDNYGSVLQVFDLVQK
jgi:hypothetical protein